MKLYVGNLPFSATEDEIRAMFDEFGSVVDLHIPMDRETGRPRGFAFVTMSSPEDGRSAIKSLNGREIDGRAITVNEARPKAERGARSGGGGRW